MKKLISLFLLLAISIGTIAGCGEKKADKPEKFNLPSATAEQAEAKPTKYVADYLPEKNYSGYKFRIIVPVNDAYSATLDANIEEETGDTVNDAIYRRNRLIEEKYGIVFEQIARPDYQSLTSTFSKSTASASDDFDLCMLIARDAWSLALGGAIIPVDKLPYLDVSQPWYSHDVNSEI